MEAWKHVLKNKLSIGNIGNKIDTSNDLKGKMAEENSNSMAGWPYFQGGKGRRRIGRGNREGKMVDVK